MRLDKLLAHCGFGTRKDVKQIIKKGHVHVDDKAIRNSNMKVNVTEQVVTVFGDVIHYQEYVYLMLHKPAGYITATEDMMHNTVMDFIPEAYLHYQVSPVGRLDKDTEGLLLLTNDGQANHVLTSPRKAVPKTYYALINGRPSENHISEFKKGVVLDDGYKTETADLHIITADDRSEILLTITEGKFHQVKRMFQAIDMEVTYLKRLTMGELVLDDDLALGDIRELTREEIKSINDLKGSQ